MSQSYGKECIFCKAKIRMSDQIGKWLPFNEDGSIHECKSKNGTSSVPSNGNGNDISVQVLLKKLSSIGIEINLEKLRNTVNGNG